MHNFLKRGWVIGEPGSPGIGNAAFFEIGGVIGEPRFPRKCIIF
jgi:hypothetical protein